MAAGSLHQIVREDGAGRSPDFSRLDPDGPWPDVIDADFTDAAGQRLRIEVETYHGAGGRWTRH
jgi:hypothetical protein